MHEQQHEAVILFAKAAVTGIVTSGAAVVAWFTGQYAGLIAAAQVTSPPTWIEGGVVAVLGLLIGSLFYFLRENSQQSHQLNLRQIEANEKIAAGRSEVETARIKADKERSVFIAQDHKDRYDKLVELVREAYRSKHATDDRLERLQERLLAVANQLPPGSITVSNISDSTTGKFIQTDSHQT